MTDDERRARRNAKAKLRRAAETPEQRAARTAKRRKYYIERHAPRQREQNKAYYWANRDRLLEYSKEYRLRPERREAELRRSRQRHGIVNPTAERKGGSCESCGNEFTVLHLDHWHHGPLKGQPRGWLCQGCNTALGLLKDDPSRCRALAEYVTKAVDQPVAAE